jgi:HD-GYP domain-containing protein (c-di-GMP phosphodiesterase class II)
VVDFATEIGRKMGLAGEDLVRVGLAARLHAIGKLSLPLEARQSTADDPIYREHSARAADYLRVSAGGEVAAAVRGHHERWDGGGFPDGLAGEEIPLGARILAVADTYDIWSHEPGGSDMAAVLARLEENAGTLFDAAVVAAARALSGRG